MRLRFRGGTYDTPESPLADLFDGRVFGLKNSSPPSTCASACLRAEGDLSWPYCSPSMSSSRLSSWRRSARERYDGARAVAVDSISMSSSEQGDNSLERATTQADPDAHAQDLPSVPGFRLRQRVGEGGMGEVFLADQLEPVRRRVALKVIKHGLATKEVLARFRAEHQALAMMEHPYIAKVFDAGATEDGRPYFTMEFIEGIPITTYCDKHRLSTRERVELFVKVCEGVEHAHQKAVIHRDLKPSNILVAVRGDQLVPKIIDFGVARATSQRLTEATLFTEFGRIIGTPEYMSPEQAEMSPEAVDTRTDVYSLGVLLYELLAGHLPLSLEDMRSAGYDEIRRMIREDEPSKPSTKVSSLDVDARNVLAKARGDGKRSLVKELRGDLDWITMQALEKDRTRRYGSVVELSGDLKRFLAEEPVLAGRPSGWYRLRKWARRNRARAVVAATVVVAVASVVVLQGIQARRLAEERDAATKAKEEAESVLSFFEDSLLENYDLEKTGREVSTADLFRSMDESVEVFEESPELELRVRMMLAHLFAGSDDASAQAEQYAAIGRLFRDLPMSEQTLDEWWRRFLTLASVADLSGDEFFVEWLASSAVWAARDEVIGLSDAFDLCANLSTSCTAAILSRHLVRLDPAFTFAFLGWQLGLPLYSPSLLPRHSFEEVFRRGGVPPGAVIPRLLVACRYRDDPPDEGALEGWLDGIRLLGGELGLRYAVDCFRETLDASVSLELLSGENLEFAQYRRVVDQLRIGNHSEATSQWQELMARTPSPNELLADPHAHVALPLIEQHLHSLAETSAQSSDAWVQWQQARLEILFRTNPEAAVELLETTPPLRKLMAASVLYGNPDADHVGNYPRPNLAAEEVLCAAVFSDGGARLHLLGYLDELAPGLCLAVAFRQQDKQLIDRIRDHAPNLVAVSTFCKEPGDPLYDERSVKLARSLVQKAPFDTLDFKARADLESELQALPLYFGVEDNFGRGRSSSVRSMEFHRRLDWAVFAESWKPEGEMAECFRQFDRDSDFGLASPAIGFVLAGLLTNSVEPAPWGRLHLLGQEVRTPILKDAIGQLSVVLLVDEELDGPILKSSLEAGPDELSDLETEFLVECLEVIFWINPRLVAGTRQIFIPLALAERAERGLVAESDLSKLEAYWFDLVEAYLSHGNDDFADELLDVLLGVDGISPRIQAAALAMPGDTSKVDLAAAAKDVLADAEGVQLADVHFHLARAFALRGQPDAAREHLETSLDGGYVGTLMFWDPYLEKIEGYRKLVSEAAARHLESSFQDPKKLE